MPKSKIHVALVVKRSLNDFNVILLIDSTLTGGIVLTDKVVKLPYRLLLKTLDEVSIIIIKKKDLAQKIFIEMKMFMSYKNFRLIII